MPEYNQRLNRLFARWEKEFGSGGKKFCRDGVMFKGKRYQNKDGWWGRIEGDANQRWHKASNRILFLMKEPNRNRGEDMREWIGRQGEEVVKEGFFSNIALWLYGLSRVDAFGNYMAFREANDAKAYTNAFDTLPLAIVNIKKASGGRTVANDTLAAYLKRANNAAYLRKEIEILQPNIVICGGGSGLVITVAREVIYPKIVFTEVDGDVCFNTKARLVLLNSYHPSWWAISTKEKYERIMKEYRRFLIATVKRKG